MKATDLVVPDLSAGATYSKKGDTYQWLQHLERRGGTLHVSEIMLNTRFGYLAAVKASRLSGAEAAAYPLRLPARGFARVESDHLHAVGRLVAACRAESHRRFET
jgi:hypothetical protein